MKFKKIIFLSMVIVVGSILLQIYFLTRNKKEEKVQSFEEQYADYLKSEYEQFEDSLYGEQEGEEDNEEEDSSHSEQKQHNVDNITRKISSHQEKNVSDICSERKFINFTQNRAVNISIYFDWDDQFNGISQLFNFLNESIQMKGSIDQNQNSQQTLTLNLNNNIHLLMEQNYSKQTDIIVQQSSLIKGRYQFISNYLCYNQIFNHIPGSNYLYGKQNLIYSQLVSTKKHRNSIKCLLEIDFYPKIFDIRNDCSSFEDYINIQHLENNKDATYISIQGSYDRVYQNFSEILMNQSNSKQDDGSQIFSCSSFWEQNKQSINQAFLIQEVVFDSHKITKQTKQQDIIQQTNEVYIVRVSFLISSTKPLIVYAQNNEFIFMKCKFGIKCHKKIKQSDFFNSFKSLNQEILAKKIFKALTYQILSVKSKLFEDSRVFEILTADFSIQEKNTIKLEEIYPFTNVYKQQDVGYDSTQKKFLKESLLIVSQQFIDKISGFQEIHKLSQTFANNNQTNQVDEVSLFKSKDQNSQVYLNSNFLEIIINENLKDKTAYKFISPHCS